MDFGLACLQSTPAAPGKLLEERDPTMTVHCHRCGSDNLRPSHFRWMDVLNRVVLRSPVRCRYCRVRFYVSILNIRGIRRDADQRRARERYSVQIERIAGTERQRIRD